ncbi:helix-turn-helix domain-containing protein [Streptosporangium canum]|uniref:helix-turn-helix domain-containing protein n=1 Tax=Streptosporangium canum TaxID=324952 RepID=UPI00342B4E4E
MGRPTKLTPQVQADLLAALQAGHSIASAAEMAGISERTVHTWRERGQADDAPEEFAQFAQALTRARAKARDILVAAAFAEAVGGIEIQQTIRPDGTEDVRTTPPNGRLALELPARMHPDWRPVKAVEISGPQGAVAVDHNTEVIERLAARIKETRARHERWQAQQSQAAAGAPA